MNASRHNRADSAGGGQVEWLTGRDGTQHFQRCFPAGAPRAFLVYLHGIEGHSLWFKDTAAFLAANGITTLAVDRRGSGMSKERRGHMKSSQQLLDDAADAVRHAHERAGALPLFLMANCWGAKLAALLSERQRSECRLLSGLIFSSPAITVKVDLSFADKMTAFLRFLAGSLLPLDIPLQIEDFTDNPQYLEFIASDPLRLTQATGSFFVNTFLLTVASKMSATRLSLPTLVLQSGTDSIVETDGLRKWFECLAAADKTYHTFAGCRHSLDFDADPQEYRQILLSWIQAHLPDTVSSSGGRSTREQSEP
jgi:alpha-beta hydrolase superfamily lysophospholipase